MDDRMDAVKAELEAVSFVGETLAPFFLQDPPHRHGGRCVSGGGAAPCTGSG